MSSSVVNGQSIPPGIRTMAGMAATRNERLLVMATVAAVLLVLTLVASTFIDTFGEIHTIDAAAYYDQSLDPFSRDNNPPYSYRFLTPLLAGVLPISSLLGFAIVNASGFAVLFHLVYHYLRRLQFPIYASLAGVTVIASSPTLIYTFSNTCLVDSLSYVFLLSAFVAVLEKNDRLFILATALGVMNKEIVLLAVPLYLIHATEKGRMWAAFVKTVAVSLPAVLLFVAIRLHFGLGEYHTLSTIDFVFDFHADEPLARIVYLIYIPFGALWFLVAWRAKDEARPFLKKSTFLLFLVFAQLLVATDVDRMLFVGFPVILPLAIGMVVRDNDAGRRLIVKAVLSSLLVLTLAAIPLYNLLGESIETGIHDIYLDLSALVCQAAVLLMLALHPCSLIPERVSSSTMSSQGNDCDSEKGENG